MDLQEEEEELSIKRLPDEIIILILRNNSVREIINFAATCKHYNVMIKNHTLLWRYKCASILDPVIFKTMSDYYSGRWLHELKYYSRIKQKIFDDLEAMGPKYYWAASTQVLDNNVKDLFNTTNISNIKRYLYNIHILQNIIKTGEKSLATNVCKKSYTLTEMYYAKIVLQQYMHTFLAVKYMKSKLEQDISPEFVVNFFLQWIDPGNLYIETELDKKIESLVERVNTILDSDETNYASCAAKRIMSTAYHIVFKEKHMALTAIADMDTLNISKIIDKRYGNYLVVAILYQAVASRCGADCDILIYPGHFYVRWTDHHNPKLPVTYVVDLDTGDMKNKKENENALKLGFIPDILLQYLYSMYSATMGAIRSWYTNNAIFLLDYLGTGHVSIDAGYNSDNIYKNYTSYLLKNASSLIQCPNLDYKKLTKDHIEIITSLSKSIMNVEVKFRPQIAKRHYSQVKYAVGMICYHKKLDYTCIIRGWDLVGCAHLIPRATDLYFGFNQPFYYVTAADQSERYVAQENLVELTRPTRLYHLEHQISREFTHFDGFAYAPNDLKKFEYPGDMPIVETFRAACQLKPDNID